jgi:hypothetical protein
LQRVTTSCGQKSEGSNPQRLRKAWANIFPFVRNVIT